MLARMHVPAAVWIGGAFVVVALLAIIAMRRKRPHDLGSVSTAWTTQQNVASRGADESGR